MTTSITKHVFLLALSTALASCGSLRTFHDYARAGDTIAIPVGMQPDFNKDNITVQITPSLGAPITLTATDPAIRAIINFYPDPVSSMIVSREINTDITPFAQQYALSTEVMANEDKDWYQTTVFLNLPASLPVGLTQIEVMNAQSVTHSSTLDIISGVGTPNTFAADIGVGLPLDNNMLDSLARVDHFTVSLDSTTIPHAIEVNFTHDPDVTVGGSGQAFVVNPLGYRKNLHWSDNGTNLKVILMESKTGIIDHMNDYKFYIAGTATNLVQGSVSGYDSNGNVVPGVTLTLTSN